MSNRIDIATCCDLRMVDAASVLAASLKAHARAERPVRLFVVTDAPSSDLAALAAEMGDVTFQLVPIACTNLHGDFPIRDHITAGTYLRFMLPELLPDVGKVLYLDGDIAVHRNVETLFDTELNGLAMAAVPDWSMVVGSRTWPTFFIPHKGEKLRFSGYVKTVLGLDCETSDEYFNCGVLILDLDVWRRDDVAGRAVKYLIDNPGLYYMDQDALNYIMGGRYVRLDTRWNSFANCAFPAYVNLLVRATAAGRRWEATRAIWRRDPWIIHYAGANKPWNPHETKTPLDAIWWRYAALSPHKDQIVATYRARETKAQARRSKVPRALAEASALVSYPPLREARGRGTTR